MSPDRMRLLGAGRIPPAARALSERLDGLPKPVTAALLMLAATMLLSAMHAAIRGLSDAHHPFEIAFFRNLFGLVVFVPVLLRSGFAILRTNRLHLHAVRAVLQVAAMLMFFMALALLPLAEVSALSFTSPLFAAIFAVVLLGERLRLRRMTALVVGFIGALIIIRPGVVTMDEGSLLVLGSSAIWAVAILIVKQLSRTDSSVTITAYMILFLTPLSLAPALFVWRWPTAAEYVGLLGIAVMGTVSHIAIAQSFKYADATAVLPYDFTRLIWASLLGLAFFAEVPSLWTLAGGTMIFSSTTYIAFREARIGKTGG